MATRDQIDSLKQRISRADGIPSFVGVIAELQNLEPGQDGGEELDELRLNAFDALARITQDAPSDAGPIIIRYLLPICLRAKMEFGVRHVGHRYDEALSVWLDRFPPLHHSIIRAQVLETLVKSLDGATAHRACRLIGMLGYRNEQAFSRLLDLARTGVDAIHDVALRALTAVGVPAPLNSAVVELWLQRASAVPCNHDLIGTAGQLAHRDVLGLVFDRWLTRENLHDPDADRQILSHLAIAVPAHVADRFPDDAELQDQVWDQLLALEAIAPELFFFRVLGSTQVAHPCDSPGVVRYYLSMLTSDERARDLAYFRLEECERPRQLLGWEHDCGLDVVRSALQDAEATTAMVGRFMTQELRRKQHAWQTLLSLGRGEALAHVEGAIASENNGHAIGSVLEFAACFQIDPVPQRIRDLIAGEFGGIAEDDSERVSSHVGAIAVAHASRSSSALEALMAFRLIRKGGVLISLLDALADTAAALIRAGDTSAAERLWQATATGKPKHRREAAAAALGRLLGLDLLRPVPADRFAALIDDETLEPYARSVILEAVGHLPAGEVPSQLVQVIRRALAGPRAIAGEALGADFRPVALTALARLGLLAEDPDGIRQYLGLRLEGTTWRYNRQTALPGAPVVIGILYARGPASYALAAADLLRDGDWTAVVQLAPFLRSGPQPAPEPVVSSLLQRVQRAGPEIAEPDLVPLLADIAPGHITSESWSGMFGWPAQVRAALADALARTPAPDGLNRRVMNLLVVLMGDGQYGVRRAAFRAMARISPEGLRSVCAGWALLTEANVKPPERPYVMDLRRRAAEAAAWLEPISAEGPIADLAFDPEPDVRATFDRCRRERRERDWAGGYLRQVLTACDDASLLSAWKYGRALERVGDDDSLERLEERRQQDLPPGVRHWIRHLIKNLRDRWDEVTRNWPEPWFARRGRLERVDALVGEDEANSKQMSCWLWQVPATDVVDFGVWGGWCVAAALPIAMQTLRVHGRRPATIIVTQVTWGTQGIGPTYFKGSGPYPEPAEMQASATAG